LTICAAVVLVALAVAPAQAQGPASVEATLEPTAVTVGDPITLTVVVRHATGADVTFPDSPDVFAPLDLIEASDVETDDQDSGTSESVATYTLAAFAVEDVALAPLQIDVEGEGQLLAEMGDITVEATVPEDSPVQFRDLKQPLQASAGTPTWVWAALCMAGFAAISVFTMALTRVPALGTWGTAQVQHEEPGTPQRPRDAEVQLEALRNAGLLERGEVVEYYRRLSEGLRAYLAIRFGVAAGAMTPAELEGKLDTVGMKRLAVRQAVSTLEQCQSVQFAGYEPTRERAEADLAAALEVIRLTSEADVTAE